MDGIENMIKRGDIKNEHRKKSNFRPENMCLWNK